MLHGKLVSLRPMERDDIPRLWEFAQDLSVGLLTGFDGRPTPLEAVEKIYEDRYSSASDKNVTFGIEAHDLLIGGIEMRTGNQLHEVGVADLVHGQQRDVAIAGLPHRRHARDVALAAAVLEIDREADADDRLDAHAGATRNNDNLVMVERGTQPKSTPISKGRAHYLNLLS